MLIHPINYQSPTHQVYPLPTTHYPPITSFPGVQLHTLPDSSLLTPHSSLRIISQKENHAL